MNLFHPVKIGSLSLDGNIFLAPVAGYSDRSFRSICIEKGACFTYTEMVSAEALVRKNEKTEVLMQRASNEKNIPFRFLAEIQMSWQKRLKSYFVKLPVNVSI